MSASKQASKQASRILWLDTIRVVAAFLVLISHFAYFFNFERLGFINNYFAGTTGRIGVCIFFAISGYLVSNSLEKNSNIVHFYKTKFVHICLPYLTSYLFISTVLLTLSFVRPEFIDWTPITKVLFVGGDYKALFFGLLPIDSYVVNYFGLNGYWFVGEWFIGTVVSLYLFAPVLYVLAKKIPIVSTLILIAVSIIMYSASRNLPVHGFWFFIVRCPEFFIGILLHMYREKLLINENKILYMSFIVMIMVAIIDMLLYNQNFIADRFIPLKPRSFLFSIPLIISSFICLKKLNDWYDLKMINSYSNITYSFMLIQHIVINIFIWNFDEKNLSKLGVIILLLGIFGVTILFAKKITTIYKPIEKYLLDKI